MPTTNSAKKLKPMTKKNLQYFEKRLLEERRRVLKELGRADEVDVRGGDVRVHLADDADAASVGAHFCRPSARHRVLVRCLELRLDT